MCSTNCPPTVSEQRREVQDVRECNAIVRYAPCPSFFIPSTVSFSVLLSHVTAPQVSMCACYVSVGADAVTPLRRPSLATHTSGIRVERACGYIRPPPYENSATRVFYSNFRSAYLNSASFFLSLFVESGCCVDCFVPLPDMRVSRTRMCRVCEYVSTASTSCSPSEFHPLFRIDPRCQSERVTVVSRATASPTRAGNLHTRVRL